MSHSWGISRARTLAVIGAAAGALALGACSPPPATPDPSTPWLAAGCIDSSIDEGEYLPGDFYFSGVANEAGNGVAFGTEGMESNDGTCSGEPTGNTYAVIRASDAAGAASICDDLGLPVSNPARLVDFGYEVPIDAWTCLEAPA